jgi:hypothetical protein
MGACTSCSNGPVRFVARIDFKESKSLCRGTRPTAAIGHISDTRSSRVRAFSAPLTDPPHSGNNGKVRPAADLLHRWYDFEISDHRTACIAPSMRRVADAAFSFATLVYPIMSPLSPEPFSEQRERDAGPIPCRRKCSTISESPRPPRSEATKCIPPSWRRTSTYRVIDDSIAAASALRRSV